MNDKCDWHIESIVILHGQEIQWIPLVGAVDPDANDSLLREDKRTNADIELQKSRDSSDTEKTPGKPDSYG